VPVAVATETYIQIHARLLSEAEAEARRAERKRRHKIDDLRYALKKVSRHIDLEMSYEEVCESVASQTGSSVPH
jgi:hypothetical protein